LRAKRAGGKREKRCRPAATGFVVGETTKKHKNKRKKRVVIGGGGKSKLISPEG